MPMLIDSFLNERKLPGIYGSFSDNKRYHDHYISEKEMGRQQKMQKSEKSEAGIFDRQIGQKLG